MDRWYLKPKRFSGNLELGEQRVPVRFSVEISKRGVAKIAIDRLIWDQSTKFIIEAYDNQETAQRFFEFTLTGQARDGSTFHSSTVIFNSLGRRFTDSGPITIKPKPWCSECKIVLPGTRGETSGVRALLRGFSSIHPIKADCHLGALEMRAPMILAASEKELLTGTLIIDGPPKDTEFMSWRTEVEGLFKHIRSVMSFARGARLSAPIVETIWNGQTELNIFATSSQNGNFPGAFTVFDYATIFKQAVESHFFERGRAKKIDIAIEWFTMPSGYREAKLTSAMTVLENLLTANLSDADLTLRNANQFKKLRSNILDAARAKLEELGATKETIDDEIKTMREKLSDLNRRTLKDKINILAKRWGVPLDGISEDALGEAKRARDHIVHQGQYISKDPDELLRHIRLTRELVIRFILAALEFEGEYTSPLRSENKQDFKRLHPHPN